MRRERRWPSSQRRQRGLTASASEGDSDGVADRSSSSSSSSEEEDAEEAEEEEEPSPVTGGKPMSYLCPTCVLAGIGHG